jgi:hypothetical protein
MPNQNTMMAVLNVLQNQSYLPSDLIRLMLEQGYGESDIKESVAQLLHDEQLTLASDRHIHLQAVAAAI